MNRFQKDIKYRSKKILDSAKGEQCTLRIPGVCSCNPTETIAAHINTIFRGMGVKSHDIHIVYACSRCHDWLDGRLRSNIELNKEAEVLRALIETQHKLIQKALL